MAAAKWLPKISGTFIPKVGTAYDLGAFGTIDEWRDGQTTKAATEITFQANAYDNILGDVLNALFGTEYPTVRIPFTGGSGTFVEGEVVTESTSTATGTLRRADVAGTSKVLFLVPVSGTFTGGQALTGGTSGATGTGGTIIPPASGRHHVFRRLNTNNPVTYTIYDSSPVSDDRAAYCALDTFAIEVISGQFARIDTKWMGKKLANTTPQTPAYVAQNPFLAKFATASFASTYGGLDAATAVNVERVKLDFSKNLTDFQAFGSTDVTGFYNQQFSVKGDMTLLYNATTFRDYAIASTNQAMRLTITNTDATAISGSSYPTLQFDAPSLAFTDFSRVTDNNKLVTQTLKFTAEFDVATAMTIQALLSNTLVTAF